MKDREPLHRLIDGLSDAQAEEVFALVVEQLQYSKSAEAEIPWPPAFFSSFDGEPDLAEQSQAILRKRFGEQ